MKKNVAMFKKSEDIFIQRKEDEIYLSDGKIIVLIPVWQYRAHFMPESGRFPEIPDDSVYAVRGDKKSIPTKQQSTLDLSAIFEKSVAESEKNVTTSPFLMEYEVGRKKENIRMLICDGTYIGINNRYHELSTEINVGSYMNNGKKNCAVVASSGNCGILILPIRFNQETLENFVNCR